MTFSIVAVDVAAAQIGVAVQSKFLAVGALVPWARAGVGAVATQALADVTLGPRGLAALERGLDPATVVEQLLAADPDREQRQLGLVAADGRAASFTGSECFEHAGSRSGDGFAAQGNILAGRAVVDGLVEGFLATVGQPLADRLLAALETAQAAGGDRRGQQSAALLVVKAGGGYGGNHDRMVDLRVDDDPRPIEELRRILGLHRLYFARASEAALVAVDEGLRRELSAVLERRGFMAPGTSLGEALFTYLGWENLEERWAGAERIDPVVLHYIREREAEQG